MKLPSNPLLLLDLPPQHKDRMLIFEDIKLMFEESSVNYDETLLFKLFCKVGLSIVMLQGVSRESSLRVFLKNLP